MKIALLGDIAFFGKYSLEKNRNVKTYFKSIAQFLSNYDYVIGNLESPFVTNQHPHGPKSAHIKSDPVNIELLKYLNIGIVNLANNHIYDYGKRSFELTKRLLNENSISFFGVDEKQVVICKNDTNIAFHGYCCFSTNPLGVNKGINKLSIDTVSENLKSNTSKGYFNIISVHCGQEHVHTPNYDHVIMARQFADICPYVFYGHHPHVIQGIEEVNNSLIAYSLGNFCFDDVYTKKSNKPLIKQSIQNKESYILELELKEGKLLSHKAIPIYLGDSQLEVNKSGILQKLEKYSSRLNNRKEHYIKERTEHINKYISSRKKLRNFKWYYSRLNIKSAGMILSAYRNKKLYKRNISDQLPNS